MHDPDPHARAEACARQLPPEGHCAPTHPLLPARQPRKGPGQTGQCRAGRQSLSPRCCDCRVGDRTLTSPSRVLARASRGKHLLHRVTGTPLPVIPTQRNDGADWLVSPPSLTTPLSAFSHILGNQFTAGTETRLEAPVRPRPSSTEPHPQDKH